MHRFVLHNGRIIEAAEKHLSAGQVGLLAGWGVFSTIRLFDGVLFAFERHWERMRRDAGLLSVPFPDERERIEHDLLKLADANQVKNATVRALVVRNRGGMWEGPGRERDSDFIALMAEVKDWGAGVRLAVVPQARHAQMAFAGTKILSWACNLVWYEQAQAGGCDEAILLNERGEVCECASANIFATQGRKVWTPPLSSGCLPGVTRELLLREVSAPGFEVGERDLTLADLAESDEIFITSTTRELLPVISIEGLRIRENHQARAALQAAFSRYVDAYVARTRQRLADEAAAARS